MHDAEEQARYGDDLLEEITVANTEDFRNDRLGCSITITVRHTDLPEGVSSGTVYLPCSLPGILQATKAAVSAILRSVEAGISEAGSATLSPGRNGSSVHRAPMVVPSVVRDCEKRR